MERHLTMTATPPADIDEKSAPEPHGPFGRVVTSPRSSATPASPTWVTWLLFMVPLCIAELRGRPEPEIKRVSERAADLIASHGDDAQYGGQYQRSARTAIAKGLAVLARAEGGVTALGIHACIHPHVGCPGDTTVHPRPSQCEERNV